MVESGAAAVRSETGPLGTLAINMFDGSRKPFTGNAVLVNVRDGNQKQVLRQDFTSPSIRVKDLTVFHNQGDNYAVVVSSPGYKDAGFYRVKIEAGQTRSVDLMLIPSVSSFNFFRAAWNALASDIALKTLLAAGASDDGTASTRYGEVMEASGGALLACLLNLVAVMKQVLLPQGSAFSYLKEIVWDRSGPNAIAQDRFFAWADPGLLDQVEIAKQQKKFVDAPHLLHGDATASYKQVQFGEANLQLTFHANDRKEINGQTCILVEPDIDYYKDPGAHLLLEVLVNGFGSLSDPKHVYVLRWIAGRQAGVPEFDPLYTIEKA